MFKEFECEINKVMVEFEVFGEVLKLVEEFFFSD